MRRAIYTLLVIGFAMLPMAIANAQTYADYEPPFYNTGGGFWYTDPWQDSQFRYTTYEDAQRNQAQSGDPQRFYRSHNNVNISIADNSDPVHAGDALTYFITVGNPYATTASVDIVAYLDPNTDFRSASNDGQRNGDRVSFRNFIVYGHTNRTISVTVRVDDAVYDAQQLRFRVVAENASSTELTNVDDYGRRAPLGPTVYAPDYPVTRGDHGINNNYVQHTTRPTTANERYPDRDFQVTLRKRISDGDALYTLTVENHTNRTLKDVDVTHQFFTFVDKMEILSTNGGSDKGDRISWDLGWLAPHEYKALTYRVRFHPTAGPVRTSVEALSRDPALRATTADTMQAGRGGDQHFTYNYDAIAYPQTGASDFFGKVTDASALLTKPVQSKQIPSSVSVMLLPLVTGAAVLKRKFRM